jgi:hypothetical protein
MKKPTAILLTGWVLFTFSAHAMALDTSLARAITNQVYFPPSPAEVAQATRLFQRTLLARSMAPDLADAWTAVGFEITEVAAAQETLWLLAEPSENERGRGWYLIRPHHAAPVALQAPHAKNDLHTGRIALQLFLSGNARVLAAATISRHEADMAHLDNTFIQALTLAFAESYPTGRVVQLHGFSAAKHPKARADMIVSAGTPSPQPWLALVDQTLTRTTALAVRSYPEEIQELGGTLNAQGRALRRVGETEFLHVELSKALRERLLTDEALLRAMMRALPVNNCR